MLLTDIAFLEIQDVCPKTGNILTNVANKGVTIVMVGAGWCGYCTKTCPSYQEFNNSNTTGANVCAIQIDGPTDGAKALGEKVGDLYGVPGLPTFLIFVDGVHQKNIEVESRTVQGYTDACNSAKN